MVTLTIFFFTTVISIDIRDISGPHDITYSLHPKPSAKVSSRGSSYIESANQLLGQARSLKNRLELRGSGCSNVAISITNKIPFFEQNYL